MADPLNLTTRRAGASVWEERSRLRDALEELDVECLLVGLGGVVLVADGLRRGSAAGALETIAGGGLLYRAMTGRHDGSLLFGWATRELASRGWLREKDVVEESSDESFPASDSPSWTPTSGATTSRRRARAKKT